MYHHAYHLGSKIFGLEGCYQSGEGRAALTMALTRYSLFSSLNLVTKFSTALFRQLFFYMLTYSCIFITDISKLNTIILPGSRSSRDLIKLRADNLNSFVLLSIQYEILYPCCTKVKKKTE
jgi:hypothetical protein